MVRKPLGTTLPQDENLLLVPRHPYNALPSHPEWKQLSAAVHLWRHNPVDL